jgi:PD-(D/E)XK nuclease superfamily protein
MNTKQRGDIAEQAAVLEALTRGWGVLRPLGDNLPYDLVFDVGGQFVKVQVKHAWFDDPSQNYVVDNRRTKTNRRQMVRQDYKPSDFDFALVYLPEKNIFYVYPVEVFISFGSEIHMVEADRRQRRPRSSAYRDALHLIVQWASQEEILVRTPVKVGEAVSRVIPSQVPFGSYLMGKV